MPDDPYSTQRHRWWLQEQVVPGVWTTFSSSPTRASARRMVATLRERAPERRYRVLDTWMAAPDA